MFNKRIRAWHIKTETMHDVANMDLVYELIYYKEIDSGVPFKKVILMQDSGLKDENKDIIFEGDIIVFESTLYEVKYGDYGDSVKGTNGFGWYIACGLGSHPYMGGGIKTGNIYENPELYTGLIWQ